MAQEQTQNTPAAAPKAPLLNVNDTQDDNLLYTILGYYHTFVKPYLWLYPLSVILFLIGGFIFLRTAVPIYQAQSQLLVKSQEVKAIDVKGIGESNSRYSYYNSTFLATQIPVIQSDEIMSKAYKRVEAMSNDTSVFKGVQVKNVRDTDLINISVRSTNSEAAANLANAIAEVYIEFTEQRRSNLSHSGMELLREQLKDVQANRNKAVEELFKFKQENGVFDLNQSYATLNEQLKELTGKLFEASLDQDEIEMTLQEVRANRKMASIMLPYLVDKDNSNMDYLQRLKLSQEMKLPELKGQYGEQSIAIKTHNDVNQMIDDAAEREVERTLNGLELKRSRITKRKAQIESQIEEIKAKLVDLDRLAGDFRVKEATCNTLDTTLTRITNRINEIQIADATTLASYSIYKVNDAKPAKRPVYPLPKTVLMASLAGGIAVAFVICFILVSVNTQITNTDQIIQILGKNISIFGTVPYFDEEEEKLLKSDGNANVDEVFRDIRTSLNLSMLTRNSKILCVSSSLMSEGKTFTICCLARSFARENKRVLLVDLDLRKPEIHKRLAAFLKPEDSKRGISNVLVGDCKLEDIIIHIDELNLDVALAGPVPPNPNELLGNTSFNELLQECQEKYDLTLIDTPPIMPVSDTLLIASRNIPILLVTRLFRLTKPVLASLNNRLHQLNITPAGLIISNADLPKNPSYGYGYGYGGYGYGYGYGGGYGYGKYGYGYGYGYGKYGEKLKEEEKEKSTKGFLGNLLGKKQHHHHTHKQSSQDDQKS